MRHRIAIPTLIASVFAPALAAAQPTPENPDRFFSAGGRALSGLRQLEDRALDLEYPSAGNFFLFGTQARKLSVLPPGETVAKDMLFARTNIQVGWGWEHFKLGLFWDGMALGERVDFMLGGFRGSGALDPGDYGVTGSAVFALSANYDANTSLTLAGIQTESRLARTGGGVESEVSSLSPLLRARAFGAKLELGFPKEQDGFKVGAILGSLELLKVAALVGAYGTEGRTSALLGFIGGLDTLVEYYGAGSNPYVLDLARENVGETDVGLELRTSPVSSYFAAARALYAVTGDPGFRRAELELDYRVTILPGRIVGSFTSPYLPYNFIPFSWVVGFFGGMGSAGVTTLGLSARVFAVRLDDGFHPGFSAGLRVESFTNHARLKGGEPGGLLGDLLLDWEGERSEHVRTYIEARASMNELVSSAGLPYPDAVAFGLFYVAEGLDAAPNATERGRYTTESLNALLDARQFGKWTPGSSLRKAGLTQKDLLDAVSGEDETGD